MFFFYVSEFERDLSVPVAIVGADGVFLRWSVSDIVWKIESGVDQGTCQITQWFNEKCSSNFLSLCRD